MTISVKHAFTSAKGDGSDATLIRPSNWNAEHTITMATDKLLGRATAGTGAVEEISCGSVARSLLACTTVAQMLTVLGVSPATTGDAKLTMKTAADSGWVMMDDGTIGDASSSASTRANSDTSDLFVLLYALADADAPLLTSAGAATTRAAQGAAATAYAAHCRMTLPKQLGRAFIVSGAGSGLTSRTLGSKSGAESATLSAAQIPSLTGITGSNSISVASAYNLPGISGSSWFATSMPNVGGVTSVVPYSGGAGSLVATNSMSGTNTITVAYTNASQSTVSLMQPWTAWNVMLKL